MGITFTVYSDGANIDRAWPFDVIPRVIEAARVGGGSSAGSCSACGRSTCSSTTSTTTSAIIADGVFPAELLDDSANFRPECRGVHPKFGVWAHISGSDLVRDADGTMYVLEDNLRVPSGVSYVLENRAGRQAGVRRAVRPPEHPPGRRLHRRAQQAARRRSRPTASRDPSIAVLTPGIFNSAYFEHSFLAQRMGAELVEGADLVVGDDDCVYMRTIDGLERVDVIYRRIDDLFLDPEVFRPDSMLGVPGLMRAWKAGNVGIANAPGAGVADDKVVYAWVPDLIRYYLGEEPLIANVPTYRCLYDDERRFVLDNLARAGAQAGQRERRLRHRHRQPGHRRRARRRGRGDRGRPAQLGRPADPRSCRRRRRCATTRVEPRHVDLRPFILTGATSYVTAGGLTRVALPKGSLVVNSSQGGGSKDTWIVDLGAGWASY